jgi:hypothetical protein
MQRAIGIGLLLLVGLLVTRPAEADILCKWFGQCLYESPGFRIAVVDRETGQPLTDVDALAEWVQYGYHGTGGPLMVQHAVSGPDGLLAFLPWGPIRGSTAGLAVGYDPFVSLFKPGYKVYETNNRGGSLDERARVRGFGGDGQIYFLEPFRGTPEEWVEQLRKAAYPARAGGTSKEQAWQFRDQYLNRMRRVWSERDKVPQRYQKEGQLLWHIERDIKLYEGGAR